jgi:hypothetical protein
MLQSWLGLFSLANLVSNRGGLMSVGLRSRRQDISVFDHALGVQLSLSRNVRAKSKKNENRLDALSNLSWTMLNSIVYHVELCHEFDVIFYQIIVKTLPSVLLKYCCQSELTVVLQTILVKVWNHDAVCSSAMSRKHGAASADVMGLLWCLLKGSYAAPRGGVNRC